MSDYILWRMFNEKEVYVAYRLPPVWGYTTEHEEAGHMSEEDRDAFLADMDSFGAVAGADLVGD